MGSTRRVRCGRGHVDMAGCHYGSRERRFSSGCRRGTGPDRGMVIGTQAPPYVTRGRSHLERCARRYPIGFQRRLICRGNAGGRFPQPGQHVLACARRPRPARRAAAEPRWVLYRPAADPVVRGSAELLRALRKRLGGRTPIDAVFRQATAFTHPRRVAIAQVLATGALATDVLARRTHATTAVSRGCAGPSSATVPGSTGTPHRARRRRTPTSGAFPKNGHLL